ncbi:hypothetical protein RND71_044052 [Anisodus tanguticus]|uniref:inositol oxygenase n=1 Tax=Anisodus tanguticus TaxID=243964 RepID=A0AAE1QNW1_9SOLA|nr:hypothetical protein RND71_044052 [Anisodus tanguticus]
MAVKSANIKGHLTWEWSQKDNHIRSVSRLVIIHEEAEDGNAMPDLSVPVQAVSKAVQNLVKVGRETIHNSDDLILKQDMPGSLQRVEKASKLLEEACAIFKIDPFSQPAREKLIEGARGILGGTSSLLLCFDESEVRKIIKHCKKFLEYLTVTEVIDSMNDLVQFVKDVTPCLTRVTRDVDLRQKELTHTKHRDILIKSLDSVKTLAPILICSMKIYIQLLTETKITSEAIENRNYLGSRMTDEIVEIIRVLQLTTSDDDDWAGDDLTCLRKALGAILAKMQAAHDFLENSSDLVGGMGEKSLRHILDLALKISDYCHPHQRALIRKQVGDLRALIDALCELRAQNKGTSPQAQSMARSIGIQLKQLVQTIENAIRDLERDGLQVPKQTLKGRLEQAMRFLSNPGIYDKNLGLQAIKSIIDEARRIASSCPPYAANELRRAAAEVEQLVKQLEDFINRGLGSSPQAFALAKTLGQKLIGLKNLIDKALVDRVVNDFLDIHSPLKQFTDAVLAPLGTPNRENNFADKSNKLQDFSNNAVRTARDVSSGSAPNKRVAENLMNSAANVESLCPQLVNAGRIRLNHPENKNADEHFNNLRKQYADSLQKMRNLVDEAIDTNDFIQALEDAIRKHTGLCENAIAGQDPQKMVDNTSAIARLANRVLNVAKQEADNSEDPAFIDRLNRNLNNLQNAIPPPRPRPPTNTETSIPMIPRPPPPQETDDEDERFPSPAPNQPIMMAAHGLHQEVKQWSSKDNEIIAAAKRMALLMARLSQLVRGEGGTKKDLIDCAKAIAEASKHIANLAKEQAKLCTDKRMRTEDPIQKRVRETYFKMHTNQTVDFVNEKFEKWTKFNTTKLNIMDALVKLNDIVDESDPDVDMPNIVHAFQTAEKIRQDFPDLDWFHLTGLIHDLGKLMIFYGEEQWSVVGDTFPVGCDWASSVVYREESFLKNPDSSNDKYNTKLGIYKENCGLDKVKMSWGHDEYLYRVLKNHPNCTLPEEGLYMIRFHSFYPWHTGNEYLYLTNEKDDKMLQWVKLFNKYDLYTKSHDEPDIEKLMPYYQSLIDKYIPGEISW